MKKERRRRRKRRQRGRRSRSKEARGGCSALLRAAGKKQVSPSAVLL